MSALINALTENGWLIFVIVAVVVVVINILIYTLKRRRQHRRRLERNQVISWTELQPVNQPEAIIWTELQPVNQIAPPEDNPDSPEPRRWTELQPVNQIELLENNPDSPEPRGWTELQAVNQIELLEDNTFGDGGIFEPPIDISETLRQIIGTQDKVTGDIFNPREKVYVCKVHKLAYHENSWESLGRLCDECRDGSNVEIHYLPANN